MYNHWIPKIIRCESVSIWRFLHGEQEIFDKIAAIIADRFELTQDQVTNELNFKADLDADSIDIVEFVLELKTRLVPRFQMKKLKNRNSGRCRCIH